MEKKDVKLEARIEQLFKSIAGTKKFGVVFDEELKDAHKAKGYARKYMELGWKAAHVQAHSLYEGPYSDGYWVKRETPIPKVFGTQDGTLSTQYGLAFARKEKHFLDMQSDSTKFDIWNRGRENYMGKYRYALEYTVL